MEGGLGGVESTNGICLGGVLSGAFACVLDGLLLSYCRKMSTCTC